ncbi:MAG: hypothetical protein U1A78_34250 [Polyangia bacterium]
MNRLTFTRTLAGIGLALSIGACTAPDLTPPCPIPPDADEATRKKIIASCFGGEINNIVETKLKKDVDILFVVDNSTSMTPKQRVLAGAIPQFINAIEKFGSDYHVGIVTTDVGANPTSTSAFPGNRTIPGCASFSGDDGKLQNTPCTLRMGVSTETVNACTTLCPDPKFVPMNGGRYIEKKGTVYNVPSAKDAMNNEIGPQKAFQCIALVGDGGCGVESPLESAKRALDGHLNENSGFLRSNSVLAVIFITDEDDCSVQISRRSELDPTTMNCAGNMSPDAPGSCFGLDFRCLARSVECYGTTGSTYQSMTSTGAKLNCKEKPNNFLIPLQQYVNFFNTIRPAEKLVLAGIISPSILDAQMGTGNGKLVIEQNAAGEPGTPGLVRGYKANAACYNATQMVPPEDSDKGFIGQAQLRLSTFLRKFANRSESSICDTANYPAALQIIADKIANASAVSCLAAAPKRNSAGDPICIVGYVDENTPNATPDTTLPLCSKTCCAGWKAAATPALTDPLDTTLANACKNEPDCFCAETNPKCADTAVAGVWRKLDSAGKPVQPPSGKVVNFRCARE